MTSQVSAASAAGAETSNPQAAAGKTDALSQRDTFLKLLVAQIRNQDPLNPSDGLQFVSQLAQFSELEQVIQIRSELESLRAALEQAGSAGGSGGTSDETKESQNV